MILSHRATNIVVALAAAMFFFACHGAPDDAAVRVGGGTMGTRWTATLLPPAESTATAEEWTALVQAALDQVDKAMSTYQEDSDLNRFARAQAGVRVPLSP
ncbi:MAG: FAD:protein FMN transferase, partial [Planctomycetes bacterium]|nr:FAD:protein FMN transferase [Planctomycetota bacterium]